MASRFRREHARVAALYHAEREAAEALRAMDEIKNTFLSAVSHELRTPLTSVFGFAVTLQDRAPELDPVSRDMLEHLVAEARNLDMLLDDLLDLDRLTRGRVALRAHETDVAALARQVAGAVSAREDRTIDVDADEAVAVVDERKVERIVENLLNNATKYAPPPATIRVLVRSEGDAVLISVDDAGPGVPVELRGAIFEPFRRGATASSHSPGTGIGLSLVERFTKLHGGRVWVQDSGGGGASFRVMLPRTPLGPAAGAAGDSA
jgi:signal transduction histidine kinase